VTQDVSQAPPRLALVTGSLDLGGTTTFLCNLGGELVRRGVPVRVFSFERNNPLGADFSRLNIPVSVYDERRLIYEDRLLLLLEELGAFKPTAVVANLSATSFEVLRYVPRGVFRIGTAQSSHAGALRLVQSYAGEVDLIVAISQTIKETLEALPEFASVPVKYLPLGVPIPEAANLPQRDFQAPLRILYLGRLAREHKRAHLLAKIFFELNESGIPFHWTIGGDGPERASLEQQMKSQGDQTVTFAGQVAYEDVPALLASHDILLLVSDSEGMPLSLLEAMGFGLIPVVSDLPSGIREVVDDTTGKRIAPENIAGYGDTIIWLHNHRQEMRELSKMARQRVEQEFSVSAMAGRWLKILPNAQADIHWPAHYTVQPILAAASSWRYSPPIRVLRRLLRRLR
jgi:glycosyltransferase involved in cell wall biosynthesis